MSIPTGNAQIKFDYLILFYSPHSYTHTHTHTHTHTQIENILREDIALRFKKCKVTMERELSNKERKFPYLFNLKPQIAFHGTLTKSLPSIGGYMYFSHSDQSPPSGGSGHLPCQGSLDQRMIPIQVFCQCH